MLNQIITSSIRFTFFESKVKYEKTVYNTNESFPIALEQERWMFRPALPLFIIIKSSTASSAGRCIMKKGMIIMTGGIVFCLFFMAYETSGAESGKPESRFTISGFVGQSPDLPAIGENVVLLNATTKKTVMTDRTNIFAKYSFAGLKEGTYIVKVGKIKKEVAIKGDDVRLDIDLSAPGGTMDYTGIQVNKEVPKQAANQSEPKKPQKKVSTSGVGVNRSELASQIAGIWWGYSGSTERKIGLCPGGAYRDYSESSYSGNSSDALGNQDMSWGAASQKGGQGTWTIQGDYQRGNIYVRYNNGSTATIHYEQCGDTGCLLFNGTKLCRSGKCQ